MYPDPYDHQTQFHRPAASAGVRGASPAGESLVGIPLQVKPPVFSGDTVDFHAFKKEAVMFAEYAGFGDVFNGVEKFPSPIPPSPFFK